MRDLPVWPIYICLGVVRTGDVVDYTRSLLRGYDMYQGFAMDVGKEGLEFDKWLQTHL